MSRTIYTLPSELTIALVTERPELLCLYKGELSPEAQQQLIGLLGDMINDRRKAITQMRQLEDAMQQACKQMDSLKRKMAHVVEVASGMDVDLDDI